MVARCGTVVVVRGVGGLALGAVVLAFGLTYLWPQRNGLDSAWMFDLNTDYSTGAQPVRILAQGRDVSATLDSLFLSGGFTGSFFNEGDNEITGWHLSDGDPTVDGLLGAKIPRPLVGQWRLFYTQQHGDNITYEVLRKDSSDE